MTTPVDRQHDPLQRRTLYLLPVALALTLIAGLQSLQAFAHALESGSPNYVLPGIIATTFVYYWYFIFLAYVLGTVSQKMPFRASILPRWVTTHVVLAFASFLLHRLLMLGFETVTSPAAESTTPFIYRVFNNPTIWIGLLVYAFLILLFSLQEHRRIEWENALRRLTLEEQLTHSRLHELQTKVHPGFLFNTLASIADLLLRSEHKEANRLLSLLSDFLRTTVYTVESDEATLEDELNFLQLFLGIEQVRFKGTLETTMDIQQTVRRAVVPRFVLQPVVEAIMASHSPSPENAPRIAVISRQEAGTLMMIVTGTFPGTILTSAEAQRRDLALHAVRERLRQQFGNAQSFSVETMTGEDVRIAIFCPFVERSMPTEDPGTMGGGR
jgi:two-component system, LytTR family, sensor kinase